MKSRLPIFIGLGVAVIALVGGGFWWQHATAARDEVAARLPPLPDLTTANPTLVERIHGADTQALSRSNPIAGLIELSRLYHANGYLETAMTAYRGLAELQPTEARWPHLHALASRR